MKLYTTAFLLMMMSVSVIHAGKNRTTLHNRKGAEQLQKKQDWQIRNEEQDNRPLTRAVVCCVSLSILGGAIIQGTHLAIDAAIKKMA